MAAVAVLQSLFLAFGGGGECLILGYVLFLDAGKGCAEEEGKTQGIASSERRLLFGTSSRISPPSSEKYLFFNIISSVKCLLQTTSFVLSVRSFLGIA